MWEKQKKKIKTRKKVKLSFPTGLFYCKEPQSFYWDKNRFRTNSAVPFVVDHTNKALSLTGKIHIPGSSGILHRAVLDNINKCGFP